METAYLSIDLDYGNENHSQLLEILKYAKSLKVPTVIVDDHSDIVNNLQKYSVNTLINVDEHSDLYNKPINGEFFCGGCLSSNEMHCGNWVNFSRKYADNYIWIRPTKDELGRCDGGNYVGQGRYVKVPFDQLESDYESLYTTHKNWKEILKSYKIVGVGIAFSVSGRYLYSNTALELLKDRVIRDWFEEIDPGCSEYLKREFRLDNFLGD